MNRLKLFLLLVITISNISSGQTFPNPATLSTGQGAPGNLDPIWVVSQWYPTNPPNPMGITYSPALINNNCAPGAWVAPSSLPTPINNGNWITGTSTPCISNANDGYIYFRLPLNLPSSCNGNSIAASGSYTLYLSGYVDNNIRDVFVNGVSKGIIGGNYIPGGQLNMTLTGPWVSGINYIDIQVYNVPNGGANNPYGLLLVANYTASLNSDMDGDGIADLNDSCPCQFGGLPDGCCTAPTPTSSSTQTFCNSAIVSNLNATGTNIQWYTSATGGSSLAPTTPLSNGSTYYATQTISGCESSVRLPVTVVINASSTPIGLSTQTFCNSAILSNLSATGTNIQWYTSATGGSSLAPTTPLSNGSTYYANQTISGCESPIRLPVTVVINVSSTPIGSSTQTFCNSATIANLSAIGTNIQWYTSATVGSALAPTTSLINGSTYYASQTISGCESTIRLPVTVVINASSTPTGSSPQTFCNSATIANLTVTGSNIGWYASTTGGSSLPNTTTIINGSTYYASQTISSCESSERLPVTVVINAPSTPTGLSPQTFCNSATIANLSATGSNIQWYSSSTGGTYLSSTTSLINGATYYATQTISGCESSVRLPVKVVINAPSTPTGLSPQTFCNSATIANLSATGSNIQWYSSSTGGTYLSSTTSLINGATYYATQTISSCESSVRLPVTVVINVSSTPTGLSPQTFCNSAIVSNLSATGTNIQWYTSSTGGSSLAPTTSLVNGSTYYTSQTISGCESPVRLPVTVVINAPSTPTGSSTQTFCNSAIVSNLSATGTNIQWYTSAIGGLFLSSTISLINGATYYASQTVNGCESSTRFPVNVIINTPPYPTGNLNQLFCNSATIANLTMTEQNIRWHSSATGGTTLFNTAPLINGTTYYASQTINGCESLVRTPVMVTIVAVALPSFNTSQEFCKIDNPKVSNLMLNQSNVKWYTNLTGGTPLISNFALIDNTTYYAEAADLATGCKFPDRLEVLVKINDSNPPKGDLEQMFCAEDNPEISNLIMNTSNTLLWFDSSVGGNVLPITTSLSDIESYFAEDFNNSTGCNSSTRTRVDVTLLNCTLEINNILTLNGNDLNDFVFIKNIDTFPKNEFQIFNRYGLLVWKGINYDNRHNTFVGKANVQGVYKLNEFLPTGTYFYVLTYYDSYRRNNKEIKGFLQINNNQ